MIRKLMASSGIVALIAAGGFGIAQAQTQPADPAQPPPAAAQDQQQDPAAATGAQTTEQPTADQPTAEIAESDTSLTPDQPTLASAFMGKAVYSNENQEADNIGEVTDLIVSNDGSITHAVVGVGGFLGIGQKDVAVPFDELQVVERDGDIRLIYAATREQLEQAQAFDKATYEPRGRAQQEQQAADNAAGGAAAPADQNAAGVAPAVTGTQQAAGTTETTPAPAADATANQQTAEANPPAADAGSAQQAAGAQSAAAPVEGFMSFNATDQIRASTLLGKEIYGADNNSIGEVGDLVMQPDGNTRAAVIDVGGFLGIGEKEVAIPFDQIQMTQDGNEPRLTVAMTREQLEQAPAYVRPEEAAADANTAAGVPTNTTDQQQAGATPPAAGADQQAAATPPAGGVADPTAAGQPAAGTQPAADQQMANQAAADQQFTAATQDISAETLMGKDVVSTQDESLGEVDDVVFNPKGEIQAVVVDVGGFLGVGEKSVAINFDQLNVQKNTGGDLRLQVNATQEQLQNAPAYEAEQAAPAPAQ